MSELNIYQASAPDASLLASIHIPSKIAAETGIVSDEHLASLTIESYEQKWKSWLEEASFDVFIVEAEGAPVGFITCGKLRTPPPGSSRI